MSADVINSELFKFIVTSLNNLLKLLDFVVEKVGAVPTVFAIAAGAINKKISLFNDKDILSKFGNLLKKLKNKAQKSKIQIDIEPKINNNGNTGSSISTTETTGVGGAQSGGSSLPASGATTGLALLGKAAIAAALIAVAMTAIQAAVEAWFMKIKKTEEKVSEKTNRK